LVKTEWICRNTHEQVLARSYLGTASCSSEINTDETCIRLTDPDVFVLLWIHVLMFLEVITLCNYRGYLGCVFYNLTQSVMYFPLCLYSVTFTIHTLLLFLTIIYICCLSSITD